MSSAPTEALLRRVELKVARRLDGVLQGERRGRRPGPGSEPSVTRAYEAGDDVRWVDWPLSARTGSPMVRVPEIEPVLTGWALLDRSPSMRFGSRVRTKLDAAEEILAGVGTVLRSRGDRFGLIATGSGELDLIHPPRGDRRGLASALSALAALPPAEAVATDLARAVRSLGRMARHRGLVVVISDFPDQPGLENALGVLARRHELVTVEIRDGRETELPSVGPIYLRDVETGRRRRVDTSNRSFQNRFAEVVAEDRARRAAMMARVGARHVVLRPDEDWVISLARTLDRPVVRRVNV